MQACLFGFRVYADCSDMVHMQQGSQGQVLATGADLGCAGLVPAKGISALTPGL